MSFLEKIIQVAENQQAVYNAGYSVGYENGVGTATEINKAIAEALEVIENGTY